jgi:hypothetical protein
MRLQMLEEPYCPLPQTQRYQPGAEKNGALPFDMNQRTFGHDWPVQVWGCKPCVAAGMQLLGMQHRR